MTRSWLGLITTEPLGLPVPNALSDGWTGSFDIWLVVCNIAFWRCKKLAPKLAAGHRKALARQLQTHESEGRRGSFDIWLVLPHVAFSRCKKSKTTRRTSKSARPPVKAGRGGWWC